MLCAPSSSRKVQLISLMPKGARSSGRAAPATLVQTAKHLGSSFAYQRRRVALQSRIFIPRTDASCKNFLSAFLSRAPFPWQSWFRDKYSWCASSDLGDLRRSDTVVWRGIIDGIAEFRAATSVIVRSGQTTFFWLDHWIGNSTLAETFPSLFSHCLRPNASVASVLQGSFSLCLRPRLTSAATLELDQLITCLAQVTLHPSAMDLRSLRGTVKRKHTSFSIFPLSLLLLRPTG